MKNASLSDTGMGGVSPHRPAPRKAMGPLKVTEALYLMV